MPVTAEAGSEAQQHRGELAAEPDQRGRRQVNRRHQNRWVPRLASLIVLLAGLAFVVVGIQPAWYQQLHSHVHPLAGPTPVTLGLTAEFSRLAVVIVGLLLLMLSRGLRRRKRRAWIMALAALAGVIELVRLGHLAATYGRPAAPVGLAIPAVLIGLGWLFRREFYAVGDPRTRWRALGVFTGLLTADVVIGLGYIAPRIPHGSYSLFQQLQTVLYALVGATGPVRFSDLADPRADLFGVLMGTLGVLTVVVTAYIFLRPAKPEGRLRAEDARRIRAVLTRHGNADSLGYFALRDDKSVIWSPSGKSCIGYRVQSGVMLASGDPIGDPEAWPGAIAEFLDVADRHAWVPAVLGCSERGAQAWCRHTGLTALELGDEAVVHVAGFSLKGRAMRNVRQMVTRVGRAGYVAQVRRVGDVPADELARLVRQADSWRGTTTERGFSMALGRIGASDDGNCVIATATQDGVLCALLHFVPWGEDGLSLDLMRRDRSAQPGLNDFMIVETLKAAQACLGVERISLNFAGFLAVLERGERIGAGPVLRAWRGILVFLSRWFQIESLYKFNAKFAPDWVPRFMVFTGPRDSIRIGLAALEAEAFLAWPTLGVNRIGRQLRHAVRHGRVKG